MNSEAKIIEGCQNGQRAAQEAFYQMHAAMLFGIARRYTPDYDKASDILQETFIKAFHSLNQFKGGSLAGWLKRILVNTALDYIRKENSMALTIESNVPIEIVAADASTFEHLKMEANDILALMNQLPVGYRTILNLYAIDGYSHAEIASQLNISEGTSKSQLARARQALMRLLTKTEISYSHAK